MNEIMQMFVFMHVVSIFFSVSIFLPTWYGFELFKYKDDGVSDILAYVLSCWQVCIVNGAFFFWIYEINRKLNEIKTRIVKIDKRIGDMKDTIDTRIGDVGA